MATTMTRAGPTLNVVRNDLARPRTNDGRSASATHVLARSINVATITPATPTISVIAHPSDPTG